MEHETEALVTARIVAERLAMAQSQVYRLARSGAIPSFSVGAKRGGIRFDLNEVRQALRRRPVEEVGK
jgi:predicted DNA-binding transcriptional regulator AlpA